MSLALSIPGHMPRPLVEDGPWDSAHSTFRNCKFRDLSFMSVEIRTETNEDAIT